MAKAGQILVVVDRTAADQPALGRAAEVAGRMGWGLELLICIHGGAPARWSRAADPVAVRRSLLGHQLGYLRDLARRHAGLDIATKAVWDKPLHEAIIRETLRIEPHLVMKDTHYHSVISRALVTNTDWHLIRDCPAPLWLVRAAEWAEHPTVLGCVDPTHASDQPAALDHRILAEACRLADGLGGQAHVLHCYDPAPLLAGAGALPGAAGELEQLAAEMQAGHAARLGELAAAHGLAGERTHFRSAAPADGIPSAARQLGADLVVMGAVARSRMQQAFVGSTTERVLDQLACDVMVLKPPGFESPVTYHAQAADFMELH